MDTVASKKKTNEELAIGARAGDQEQLVQLWQQVRRFAIQMAKRYSSSDAGRSGQTMDDLEQAAFIALMAAVSDYEEREECGFLTWYKFRLKTAFFDAFGWRTKKAFNDPIRDCNSLDEPVMSDEGETVTSLGDAQEDKQAQRPFEEIEEEDTHRTVLIFLASILKADQYEAVSNRFFVDEEESALDRGQRKILAGALHTMRKPKNRKALMELL